MIEILTAGALNTIQDEGRPGYLAAGVSRCGAMDRMAFAIGNALLGNPPAAAGIEVAYFPFRLRFHKDTAVAVTGAACGATIAGQVLPPCWARPVRAGDILALGPPRLGARAYVLLAGGIDVPPVMGSRSTDLKGGFGGLEGRGLKRGDVLPLAASPPGFGLPGDGFGAARPPWDRGPSDVIPLHFIRGAEFDAFEPASRAAVTGSDWVVGAQANRMGGRLSGPVLHLQAPLELFSHGILPGTIQVPANGQPIIQLADANTCGGYPKLGAVIDADLWRIAQAPVGSRLRLVETTSQEAAAALADQGRWLRELAEAASRLRAR